MSSRARLKTGPAMVRPGICRSVASIIFIHIRITSSAFHGKSSWLQDTGRELWSLSGPRGHCAVDRAFLSTGRSLAYIHPLKTPPTVIRALCFVQDKLRRFSIIQMTDKKQIFQRFLNAVGERLSSERGGPGFEPAGSTRRESDSHMRAPESSALRGRRRTLSFCRWRRRQPP